ncbi:unannotated protein [freshwater metagenome]|uniref:Unannotated protein n=1 Tax=freshwater metagenome TaxID=449393 RepID=A0A6J7H2D1_9ZZZZ|nr:glycosyltransferase [Actinomycetota bacterium]
MSISVIVPATDAAPGLDRCLAALAVSEGVEHELVVVRDQDLRTPAAARNAGAVRASGDLLIFVDADVVVQRDALALLVGALDRDPGLAAVFGAYDDRPAGCGVASGFRFLLHHAVHVAGAGEAETFWSGLGAVRRSAFERVGGFDPQRRWLEDVDLGLRLRARGERILLDPRAQGTHLKELTVGGMLRSDAFERALPWTELLLEHRSGAGALNLGARHRLQAALAVAAAGGLVLGRPRVSLAALAGFAATDVPLIRLVARVRGRREAALAVPLHVAHHLAGATGLAAGLVRSARQTPPR